MNHDPFADDPDGTQNVPTFQAQAEIQGWNEAIATYANHLRLASDSTYGSVFLTLMQILPPYDVLTQEELAQGVKLHGHVVGRTAIPRLRFKEFMDNVALDYERWFDTKATHELIARLVERYPDWDGQNSE